MLQSRSVAPSYNKDKKAKIDQHDGAVDGKYQERIRKDWRCIISREAQGLEGLRQGQAMIGEEASRRAISAMVLSPRGLMGDAVTIRYSNRSTTIMHEFDRVAPDDEVF